MVKRPPIASTEAFLRSQAARTLRRLFDSLYEGAFAIDRAGRIVWMNDKYKALLGWNGVAPIEGRILEEVIPDSLMRKVVESGQADLLDIITLGKREVVVSRIPLFDAQGQVSGALGVILYDRLQALRPIVSKFQRMQDDLAAARRELVAERRAKYSFSQLVGTSPLMRDLKAQARRAAARDTTLLLLGETGTGKELLAHAIHAASPRAARPMVRVNAAAIPEHLLEAELFGTAPGAYTGAAARPKPGKVALADGGTLFLDEVGDMPLSLQAKLLRVLQEREVEPLGSNKVVSVDVRIIAATSRDLRLMMEQGAFRPDLFYRLNVLPLTLPPLRARLEDLGILCEALLETMALEADGAMREIAPSGLARLAHYAWPGNVRELGNVLQQAVAHRDSLLLEAEDFAGLLAPSPDPIPPMAAWDSGLPDAPAQLNAGIPLTYPRPDGLTAAIMPLEAPRPLRAVLAEAERAAILRALEATGGVKLQAAKVLGISRAQLYEKLASHHLMSGKQDKVETV